MFSPSLPTLGASKGFFTQGYFILFLFFLSSSFFLFFSFFSSRCGWSGGKDLLHYQHSFTQTLNLFLFGNGLLVDLQLMPIDKHGDGFFIDGLDQD